MTDGIEPFRLPGVTVHPRAPSPLRFPLPETAELRTRGVTLRAETPDDLPFLRNLYAASRAAEMAMMAHWDEDTRRDFVDKQFAYQYLHHCNHYQPADFTIVALAGRPVGRLYLYWNDFGRDCRLFDFQLLPGLRDRGIGSAVLGALLRCAEANRFSVSLHVEPINPARRLYARFGFAAAGNELQSGAIRMVWQGGPVVPRLRIAG